MELTTEFIPLETKGMTDIIDITAEVQAIIFKNGFWEGSATVCSVGSTAGITTVEYEPGLVKTDLPEFFETIAPYRKHYAHHNTWNDDNGSSHVKASLLGCSCVIPFLEGRLVLGMWQQIVCIDFDTRPRSRRVAVQVFGIKN